jgi:hypothetical protein
MPQMVNEVVGTDAKRAFLVGRKGSTEEAAKPATSVAQFGGKGDATPPTPPIPGPNVNAAECRAYGVEVACLKRERGKCTGQTKAQCEKRINDRIDQVCKVAKTKYSCTPAGCP